MLTIPVPTSVGPRDADLDDTPEGIESWIRWYESLEPVELTADEAARWLIARQAQRQFELANWDLQSDRAEQQFG